MKEILSEMKEKVIIIVLLYSESNKIGVVRRNEYLDVFRSVKVMEFLFFDIKEISNIVFSGKSRIRDFNIIEFIRI